MAATSHFEALTGHFGVGKQIFFLEVKFYQMYGNLTIGYITSIILQVHTLFGQVLIMSLLLALDM